MELIPTLRLARALREAAHKVAFFRSTVDNPAYDGVGWHEIAGFHSWGDPATCHCGIVAQELGVQEGTITHLLSSSWTKAVQRVGEDERSHGHNWRDPEMRVCHLTGMQLHDLIHRLASEGLTASDLRSLEHLSDPVIRNAAGLTTEIYYSLLAGELVPVDFMKGDSFVLYARAWADLIEAAHGEAVTPTEARALEVA